MKDAPTRYYSLSYLMTIPRATVPRTVDSTMYKFYIL